ncbi:MAG: hypothetical protein IJ309_03570 [Clostridia bacterium]|nr:hypothetical protein [Clostridia bacterium]
MSLTFQNRMAVAGHRGDCYNYYENTISAFKAAIDAGADMIETDLRLSKDGHIVLIHDDTVNRTTNGKGKVSEMTLEELKALNAGNILTEEKIPTLKELFQLVKPLNITLNLEFKDTYTKENEGRCIKCIEDALLLACEYGLEERIVVNSFDAWVLEYVYKKYGKKYPLHGFYPYREMFNVTINPDEHLYCACIFDNENKAHYDYLIEKGIEPWIGASVTRKANLQLCQSYGARLITTNNPADIIKKLEEINNG